MYRRRILSARTNSFRYAPASGCFGASRDDGGSMSDAAPAIATGESGTASTPVAPPVAASGPASVAVPGPASAALAGSTVLDADSGLMARRFRGFLPVVVDVETGGFHSTTDALLEIAAVLIEMDADGTLRRGTTHNFHVRPF